MSTLSNSKILVTGASGFIGSHLVERLVSEGAKVAGLSRSRGHLDLIDTRNVEFFPCDLTDTERTKECVRAYNPDTIFHFAAHPDFLESYDQSISAIQINLVGTLNLLNAFYESNRSSFIFGDSCKVYGSEPPPYSSLSRVNPNSSYAIAKMAAWQLCLLYRSLYALRDVSIRPTIVYGPRQPHNIFRSVLARLSNNESCISIDGGTQTRDPLFISDLVDLCVLAVENIDKIDGLVLNCGGGAEITVIELVEQLVKGTGSSASVKACPERMRKTELLRSYCDNNEIEHLVGWRPRVSLVEGIQKLIEWESNAGIQTPMRTSKK